MTDPFDDAARDLMRRAHEADPSPAAFDPSAGLADVLARSAAKPAFRPHQGQHVTDSVRRVPSVTYAPRSVTPLSAPVFISYSHHEQGRTLVDALALRLEAHGISVVWDRLLPMDNVLSMHQWMEHTLSSSIVICVLTPDYVRDFDHETTDGMRRGIRYESRILRDRLYDTNKLSNCPIIPVAAPDFPMAEVPSVMRSLAVQRFDPATGIGVDRLVERITALDGVACEGEISGRSAPGLGYRDLIYALEHTNHTTSAATELVRQLLALPDDQDQAMELAEAFPTIERCVKTAGDTRLMRDVSEKCLRMLHSFERPLDADLNLEARVLVCGKAWYLQREHKIDKALEVTRQGIDLARQHGDAGTEAFGLKCLGRLHCVAAEDGPERDRQWNLDESERVLAEAIERFDTVAASHAGDVGTCHSLLARTALVRHRLLGDGPALAKGFTAITRAEYVVAPDGSNDHLDLTILRAELEFEQRHWERARDLLDHVIGRLREKSATADDAEILARAYLVRANGAENKTTAVRYYRHAAEIFERLGLMHPADVANWGVVEVEQHAGGSLKITADDVRQLNSLTKDPRTKLAAVAEARRQNDARMGNGSITWRPDWGLLVTTYSNQD